LNRGGKNKGHRYPGVTPSRHRKKTRRFGNHGKEKNRKGRRTV